MGRQRYLTKLALGRSAYQDFEKDDDPPSPSRHTENDTQQPDVQNSPAALRSPSGPKQQYDARGQPINADSEARRAAQRDAQNNVLALVGVVELSDQVDTQTAETRIQDRRARAKLLEAEHDCGEILETCATALQFLSHIWLDAIMQRIQIGMYDLHTPMTSILAGEWRHAYNAPSWQARLAIVFPGLGRYLVYGLIKVPFLLSVNQLLGRLQNYLGRRRLSNKTVVRLYHAITGFYQIAMWGIDLILLPIDFHSSAQSLGLSTEPLSLFPPLSSLLPWHADSFHRYAWTPLFQWSHHGFLLPRLLSSAAGLLLLSKTVYSECGDEGPVRTSLTDFILPSITDPDPEGDAIPALFTDPLGRVMYEVYTIRRGAMRWCGWAMAKRSGTLGLSGDYLRLENNFQNLALTSSTPSPHHRRTLRSHASSGSRSRPSPSSTHRSTTLAELPATQLALAIDRCLLTILMLPLDSLVARSVAWTYLTLRPGASPSQNTPFPIHLYKPFLLRNLSSPLTLTNQNFRSAFWNFGAYANKLCLAMALHCAVDVVLFAGLYAATRALGRGWFGWGKKEEEVGVDTFRERSRRRRRTRSGSGDGVDGIEAVE